MSRWPRRELIDELEVGIYHFVPRAVRRAFLCGRNPVTGKDYEHGKGLIQKRLEFLAGYYGVEVLAFAVMSNHLHVVLQRLGVGDETWVDMVVHFGRWFRRVAGRAESLAAEASRRGLRWMQGVSHSRSAFA